MKMIVPIMIVMVFLIAMPMVYAEQQTQQTSKLLLDPFYRIEMVQDVPYTYTLDFSPPDKVGDVSSAIINFQMWLNPTIVFDLTVNGELCNTPSYQVHTTYAGAGEGNIFFDCSNIITEAGTYTIVLTPDDDTGAITSWIDITYSNKPLGEIDVYGTEYQIFDEGKIFLQLLENGNTPINNATCTSTVFYPDRTKFLEDAGMTYVPTSNGFYDLDVTIPNVTGVFIVDAECIFSTDEVDFGIGSYNIINGSLISGNLTSLQFSDNDYFVLEEDGGKYFETNFNATEWFAYDMDEVTGTIIEDKSGNLQNGTLFGNTVINGAGTLNSGTDYDGVNDYITVNETGTEMEIADYESFIICVSFKTTESGQTLLEFEADDVRKFTLETNNPAKLKATITRAGSTASLIGSTATDDNAWHTACVYSRVFTATPNSAQHWLYLDNAVEDSSGNDNTGAMAIHKIWIGIEEDLGNDFEGSLDELCAVRSTQLDAFGFGIGNDMVQEYEDNKCGNFGGSADENDTLELDVVVDNVVVPNNTEQVFIRTEYQWTSSVEDVEQYLYNFSSSSFVKLTNNLMYAVSDTELLNLVPENISDFINASGNMIVKYLDENQQEFDIDTLSIDLVSAEFIYGVSSPIEVLIGGQELHVTNRRFELLQTIPEDVWTYTGNRELTDFNFDVVNETEITENVWNYSGTINTNILSQFASYIWNWTGTIANAIGDFFANKVWNFEPRNVSQVTDYSNFNVTVNTTQEDVNVSEIADAVWNADNRTVEIDDLWIGGTEYSPSETTGKVVIRLISSFKEPVTGADCELYVAYPNNTRYLSNVPMTEATASGFEGIYYVDFNHSGEFGVHPYAVNCSTVSKDYFLLDTYHVIGVNRSAISEEIWNYYNRTLTETTDPINYSLIQDLIIQYGNNNTDLTNYTLIFELIENRTVTDLTNYSYILELINSRDDIVNYTLIEELIGQINITDLTNYTLINDLINNRDDVVNYSLIFELIENRTVTDLTNYTLMQELITQYGNNNSDLTNYSYIDYLIRHRNVTDLTNYSLIEDLIGEINITDLTNYSLIQDLIVQYGNNNTDLTNYTYIQELIDSRNDITNYSLIQNLISQYGNDDNTNYTLIWDLIENRTVYDLTNYSAIEDLIKYRNVTDLTNYTLIFDLIENRTVYDLTNYSEIENLIANRDDLTNYSLIFALIENRTVYDLTDYNLIQTMVWNATTRTLTYYPDPNNLTASDVWNYVPRNLTFYPDVSNLTVNINASQVAQEVWNYGGVINDNILNQIADRVQCYLEGLLNQEDGEWIVAINSC